MARPGARLQQRAVRCGQRRRGRQRRRWRRRRRWWRWRRAGVCCHNAAVRWHRAVRRAWCGAFVVPLRSRNGIARRPASAAPRAVCAVRRVAASLGGALALGATAARRAAAAVGELAGGRSCRSWRSQPFDRGRQLHQLEVARVGRLFAGRLSAQRISGLLRQPFAQRPRDQRRSLRQPARARRHSVQPLPIRRISARWWRRIPCAQSPSWSGGL